MDDPLRRFHRRLLVKRQGLGGVLGSLIPTSSAPKQDTATLGASQNAGNPGGIISGLTSVASNVPSLGMPSSGTSPTATSNTPLTPSHSSSVGSTIAPTSSAETTTPTSSTTSTSTPAVPTTPAPTPTSTTSVADIVYTTSDGTRVIYVTSTLPTASATPAPSPSFLQNPSLEGGVFTLVGLVVLVIIFVAVTWTLRKRRRDRLERDLAAAVNFDPGATEHYERQEDSLEKRRLSGSSSGHGHGYGMQLPYTPPQGYHGAMGYGQYPPAAYRAPSPNPAAYRAPSPTVSQPAGQGGANLTRKFSDRKPVPPLLPNPAYDPSNAHVSVPPRFYQQ